MSKGCCCCWWWWWKRRRFLSLAARGWMWNRGEACILSLPPAYVLYCFVMFCHRTEQEKQWKGEKKYWLKRPQPCAADMLHTIGPVAIFSEVGIGRQRTNWDINAETTCHSIWLLQQTAHQSWKWMAVEALRPFEVDNDTVIVWN